MKTGTLIGTTKVKANILNKAFKKPAEHPDAPVDHLEQPHRDDL
jgi:hypothetical protein